MSVVVVGASHRTASLDLLERMVVAGERMPKLLHDLDAGVDVSEVAVLSTCNRTEVYLVAEKFHGAYSQVRDFFSDLTYLPPDLFADSLYLHYDEAAVRHVFEVAAGLDSAVPGEHEILGQVRDAWEVARGEGTSRRSLNLLFRHALEVGKRARTETGISRHVTSVSQAAVILASEQLAATEALPGGAASPAADPADDFTPAADRGLRSKRALLVGAGAMARGMASFLIDAGVSELVIANRTEQRARDLADSIADRLEWSEDGGADVHSIGLAELPDVLARADVVLTAADVQESLINVDDLAVALERNDRPMLVVDVGVPRNVDPAAISLPGVHVIDMTDISELTEANLAARHAEAAAVRRIVAEELLRFDATINAREMAPVVTALRTSAENVRLAELERFASRLDGLDDRQRDAVDALTRALLAKVLHTPTVRLKDAAGSSRGDRLADSVRDLFDLG